MSKPTLVISCPIDTYSGYGARARDIVRSLISIGKYDIKILSQRWGNTRFGYLNDHKEDEIASLIVPNLTSQPDIWIQHTVPNEFQKVGKYNIGITAGIETTIAHAKWIQGCNNMDLVLVSAKHAKDVFVESKFDMLDERTKQKKGVVELNTKVEILFEGVDIETYFPAKETNNTDITNTLNSIEESFNFLFVGHWLQGEFGEDRKNVGYTIKSFLETFKNKHNAPGLILKTSQVTTSILDREAVLDKIDKIKSTVKGKLPNIYLLHGDVTDSEMNDLYNHPKVKAMVCLTKGEGFGRPLLEFSVTNKPIICSGWSAPVDFLSPEFTSLVPGSLTNVHPSAAVKEMIMTEAKWFTPDGPAVAKAYKSVHKEYKKYLEAAKRQGHKNRTEFSLEAMTNKLDSILDNNIPEFPKEIKLTLPKLELPKLEKLS